MTLLFVDIFDNMSFKKHVFLNATAIKIDNNLCRSSVGILYLRIIDSVVTVEWFCVVHYVIVSTCTYVSNIFIVGTTLLSDKGVKIIAVRMWEC